MSGRNLLRGASEKTIAVLGTVDTKGEEIEYVQKLIQDAGCSCMVVDMSTKDISRKLPGISPLELLAEIGFAEEEFRKLPKHEKIEHMRAAVECSLPKFYDEKMFQGILAIGGGQNARMTASALQKLPLGVPKMMVSALLCGNRVLEPYVGTKDILVMHTVADMEGLNKVTKMILHNACHAVTGMVERPYEDVQKSRMTKVALTALGITTEGASRIRETLPPDEYEITCFHANGVGGRCMEELAVEGAFDLLVDMNLHEITCELFGGYCKGADHRLEKTVAKAIPMIVIPGAIDMIDYCIEGNEKQRRELEKKLYTFHNSSIAHVKIGMDEAVRLAEVVAMRLNKGCGEIAVILPQGGFGSESVFGQPLYQPEVDQAFMKKLKQLLKKEIKVIDVEGSINDLPCHKAIVNEIYRLARKGAREYEKEIC